MTESDGHRTAVSVSAKVASALMRAGFLVASLGALVWILGLGSSLPDRIIDLITKLPPLPEWAVKFAVYKAMFVSAAGLMVAGAVTRRLAKQDLAGQPPSLGSGSTPHVIVTPRDSIPAERNNPRNPL